LSHPDSNESSETIETPPANEFSDIVSRCLGAKLTESSGGTHSGEQEGEGQPFRGWKGKGIPHLRTWKGSLRRLWSDRTTAHKGSKLSIYRMRLYGT